MEQKEAPVDLSGGLVASSLHYDCSTDTITAIVGQGGVVECVNIHTGLRWETRQRVYPPFAVFEGSLFICDHQDKIKSLSALSDETLEIDEVPSSSRGPCHALCVDDDSIICVYMHQIFEFNKNTQLWRTVVEISGDTRKFGQRIVMNSQYIFVVADLYEAGSALLVYERQTGAFGHLEKYHQSPKLCLGLDVLFVHEYGRSSVEIRSTAKPFTRLETLVVQGKCISDICADSGNNLYAVRERSGHVERLR
jgi:hypothetical protein